MIPRSVTFAGGVSFDPEEFLFPRRLPSSRIVPSSWHRIRFETENQSIHELDRWIAQNMQGRWSSYSLRQGGKTHFYVAFENLQDAVMFRLQGGETAFRNGG